MASALVDLLLVDMDTLVAHYHDGLRHASAFTACERGNFMRPRLRFLRIGADMGVVTCFRCAALPIPTWDRD